MSILQFRRMANREGSDRVVKFDPNTGQRKLVNPATPGEDHEPWPLAGVEIVGEPPQSTSIGTRAVDQGIREGWMRRVGEKVVTAPGGPSDNPNAVVHTFVEAKTIEITTATKGIVKYKVVGQPGKYNAGTANERVDWFYRLELQNG